jgi:hypothetical protein
VTEHRDRPRHVDSSTHQPFAQATQPGHASACGPWSVHAQHRRRDGVDANVEIEPAADVGPLGLDREPIDQRRDSRVIRAGARPEPAGWWRWLCQWPPLTLPRVQYFADTTHGDAGTLTASQATFSFQLPGGVPVLQNIGESDWPFHSIIDLGNLADNESWIGATWKVPGGAPGRFLIHNRVDGTRVVRRDDEAQ